MSIVKSHSVFCDGCSNWTAEVTDSQGGARRARREAKAAGWVHRGGMDLCPPCQDNPPDGPRRFATDEEITGANPSTVSIFDLVSHPMCDS